MDSEKPLVTIITATYNREDFLPETIQSVLDQSYPNIEYIIVDDGSTDDTARVVEPYLENDLVRYVRQENQGQSVARNKGISLSKGRYIAVLDSDDLIEPDKIKDQVAFLEENPDYDIVHGDEYTIDGKSRVVSDKNMKRYSGYIYEQLLLDNCVSITTALVRAEALKAVSGFDENIKYADDYDLWLRMSVHHRFKYQAVYRGSYRVMQKQISSDKSSRFDSNRKIVEKFLHENPELASRLDEDFIWCRFHVRKGRDLSFQGRKKEALLSFITALGCKFFSISPWRAIVGLLFK